MKQAPVEAEPKAREGRARRGAARWKWKEALRWFSAEFLVVVTGVLVALALNAWWQGRQEADRERAYLRQLAADLEVNQELARSTLDQMDERVRLGAALLDALRARPLPPPDSLNRLLSDFLRIAPLYPRMGTVQALIQTGDLNLIRDDSLRTSIVDYVAAVQTSREMTAAIDAFALRALGNIHQRVDFRPLGARGSPWSHEQWSRLAEDPVFRGSVSAIAMAHATRRRGAEGVLEATTTLRRRVRAAAR